MIQIYNDEVLIFKKLKKEVTMMKQQQLQQQKMQHIQLNINNSGLHVREICHQI